MDSSRKGFWLAALAILIATVIAYAPAIDAGFVWDDDDYVTQNPVLRTTGGLARIWLEPTSIPQYYPLVHTTFWIEYRLWKIWAPGYHLVNILLHVINAVLLLVVLRRLAVPGALFCVLVFALHPVQVESVAWITERKNVLSGLFFFLSLLAWMRWRPFDESGGGGKRRDYVLALLWFVCALLSKTVTCALPAVILVLSWWRTGRVRLSLFLQTLPMFVIGAGLAALTVILERYHVRAEGPAWDYTWVERCLIAGRAVWFYAWKLVWPTDLAFSYPKWQIDSHSIVQYLLPLAAIAILVAAYLLQRRIGRGPLASLLIFGGTLVPALGFVNVFPMRYSFVADHFQYLASAALLALIAAALAKVFWRRLAPQRAGLALGGVVLAVLSLLTWKQCLIYEDLYTLWNDTLRENSESFLAHNNLGKLYLDRDEAEVALEHLTRAAEIDPNAYETQLNLGVLLFKKGDLDGAEAKFERARELRPDTPGPYNNLAAVRSKRGDLAGALELLEEALRLSPDDVDSLCSIGGVYHRLGRDAEALQSLEKALERFPRMADRRLLAVDCAMNLGRFEAAIQHALTVLNQQPGRPEAVERLAVALGRLSENREIPDVLRIADAATRPLLAQAPHILDAFAGELARTGRRSAAVAVQERAVRAAEQGGGDAAPYRERLEEYRRP